MEQTKPTHIRHRRAHGPFGSAAAAVIARPLADIDGAEGLEERARLRHDSKLVAIIGSLWRSATCP